jgi:hypothetical protein
LAHHGGQAGPPDNIQRFRFKNTNFFTTGNLNVDVDFAIQQNVNIAFTITFPEDEIALMDMPDVHNRGKVFDLIFG